MTPVKNRYLSVLVFFPISNLIQGLHSLLLREIGIAGRDERCSRLTSDCCPNTLINAHINPHC